MEQIDSLNHRNIVMHREREMHEGSCVGPNRARSGGERVHQMSEKKAVSKKAIKKGDSERQLVGFWLWEAA